MNDNRRSIRAQTFGSHAGSVLRRQLPLVITGSLGAAAGLWRLSPWRSDGSIGITIFVVAVVGITALAADRVARERAKRRSAYRTVRSPELLKGSYLNNIAGLGRSVMGDGHADADTLRTRLMRCPSGVIVLVRRDHRSYVRESVVGYFVCWTISGLANARFSSGEYTSGLDLRDEDIVVDQPAAAYVTMLFGVDFSAKMQILSLASSHLTDLFAAEAAPERLLARPATKDGERIMRRIGLLG